MKYTAIPCRYTLDPEKRLISITPIFGNRFLSKSKKAWIKDWFRHTIGNPNALQDVTHDLVYPNPTPQGNKPLTYSDLLTSPLLPDEHLYMYVPNGEFWIVSLNSKG